MLDSIDLALLGGSVLRWMDRFFKKTVITRDIPVPGHSDEFTREPYLVRYYLWRGKDGSALFFHRILLSDPGPEIHNHPWAFSAALILKGGYWEERLIGRVLPGRDVDPETCPPVTATRWVGPLSLNVIRAKAYHRLILPDGEEAWTLFFHTGKRVQKWGFLYPDGTFTPASEQGEVDGVLDPKAGGAD